jgi:hypothetical protein
MHIIFLPSNYLRFVPFISFVEALCVFVSLSIFLMFSTDVTNLLTLRYFFNKKTFGSLFVKVSKV